MTQTPPTDPNPYPVPTTALGTRIASVVSLTLLLVGGVLAGADVEVPGANTIALIGPQLAMAIVALVLHSRGGKIDVAVQAAIARARAELPPGAIAADSGALTGPLLTRDVTDWGSTPVGGVPPGGIPSDRGGVQ